MVAKKRATKKASTKKGKHIAYDGANFSKILPYFKGGPAVVINVLVHMDGCGPCQRLMGPYKRAVSKAPSDAVNVSVERQKLEQFNDDLQKSVPGASTLNAPSFPHIIKVNNSGKAVSAVTPSPSNIGSLTTNSQNSLNMAMEDIPSANNSQGPVAPPRGEDLYENTESLDLEDEAEAEAEDEAGGSVATSYRSQGNSPLMTGGRAYATLAAAGHRHRRSQRKGRSRKTHRTRRS